MSDKLMWHVVIPPDPPKPQVKLIDVVMTVGIYGLTLALISRGGEMIFNYFSISFSIALFFLTFRTYGSFRNESLISSIVSSHFYSAVGHLAHLLLLGGQWHVMSVDRNLTLIEFVGVLLALGCGFAAVVVSGLSVIECLRANRGLLALYTALGGLPSILEIIVMIATQD